MINLVFLLNIFFVDIKGEVKNPGVYSFESATIMDIVNKAGGLTRNASTSRIDLSKTVVDEMVIYIPHRSERKNNLICNCIPKICPPIKTITTTTTRLITTTIKPNTKININIASANELTLLPGIGPAIASRIIEYRTETPFLSIEDILNVRGIGDVIFAQIKDLITV